MRIGKAYVMCCRTQYSYQLNNRNPILSLVSRYDYKAKCFLVVYLNIGPLSSRWSKVFAQKLIKEALVFPRWQENVPPTKKTEWIWPVQKWAVLAAKLEAGRFQEQSWQQSWCLHVIERTTRDGFFSLFLIAVKELAGGCNLLLHCFRSVSACH